VKVRVEPDARNRSLVVEWFLFEGFESRKFFQLEGEAAKKWYEFRIKFEESGEWTIRAILKRNDDSQSSSATTVRVIGPDSEF